MRFAEPLGVRQRQFEGFFPVVQRGVEGVLLVVRVLVEQIEEAVLRVIERPVVADFQPGVQVGVHPQPPGHVFFLELRALEDFRVGREFDQRAIVFARLVRAFLLLHQHPALETGPRKLAVAETRHGERLRQRVDRLRAHAVQPDAELEHIVVVLRARVDARNALDHLAQRNAPPVVAHDHFHPVNGNVYLVAVAHDELVDGVVDDLLEQHVNAVVIMAPVADPADVHAGAGADVFERGERLDFALVVDVRLAGGGRWHRFVVNVVIWLQNAITIYYYTFFRCL